jgi:hypothetical protein
MLAGDWTGLPPRLMIFCVIDQFELLFFPRVSGSVFYVDEIVCLMQRFIGGIVCLMQHFVNEIVDLMQRFYYWGVVCLTRESKGTFLKFDYFDQHKVQGVFEF